MMEWGPGLSGLEKRKLQQALMTVAEAGASAIANQLPQLFSPDCAWRVAHPINELTGIDEALDALWLPLLAAMPDLERRDTIFVSCSYQGKTMVAALGHYCGTFRDDWLTIPATGQPMFIRYGEVYELRDGKIVQANLLWDILDVIRQAGFWPLAPSLGVEVMWPGPLTDDGLVFSDSDPVESAASIAQTLAMHATLGAHDDRVMPGRQALLDMEQKIHWHPKMMWYGPAGIGSMRGLQGFVDFHQLPFRDAFRRPTGTPEEVMAARNRHGAGHYVRIGDGAYSVTGGWPSVYAIHDGGSFAGVPATGKEVTMRVMDFYLHHEGLIRENWVPLDMLDLLKQMGFDVLERMQGKFRRDRLVD